MFEESKSRVLTATLYNRVVVDIVDLSVYNQRSDPLAGDLRSGFTVSS
jgi:hypothetical protein